MVGLKGNGYASNIKTAKKLVEEGASSGLGCP
jgi:hypothetical protein